MDDYTIKKGDSRLEKNRKRDLKYISDYVETDNHSREISDKAKLLYEKYMSGIPFKIKKYCLPFDKLEEVCRKYNDKLNAKKRNKNVEIIADRIL